MLYICKNAYKQEKYPAFQKHLHDVVCLVCIKSVFGKKSFVECGGVRIQAATQ